jgi:hypothetical protein
MNLGNSLIAKTVLMRLSYQRSSTMNAKEGGFIGGFLVLGFAIFIVGFLAGLVTAFISVSTEPATLEFMIFVFGFMTGMAAVAIILAIVRSRKLTRHSS